MRPFNRTSLELKLAYKFFFLVYHFFPFNRTSLELKHQIQVIATDPIGELLIAPVWN